MNVILFRGRPGAGKTTIARALAKHFNWPVISKDDIYDAVSGMIAEHALRNKACYDALYAILKSNAPTSCTLIIDFPYQTEGDLLILQEWCRVHQAGLKSVLVTCSDYAVWAQRLSRRSAHPLPNQLITDFETMRKNYGSMQIEPEPGELLVDSIKPVSQIVRQVAKFVSL